MKRLLIVLFLLLFSTLVAADDIQIQQAFRLYEEWLSATVAYDRIPGISAGFVMDQKLVWSKGLGYADLATRKPATPETLYGICSISKLFTAIAVLQMRDNGKLQLSDPVARYLPHSKIEGADKNSPELTVESLLTHSSGLPRESNHHYWSDPDFTFPSKEEVIQGLHSQKMLYPSERYFQYSNLGITLAGEIVEEVTDRTYEQYVQDEILKPLKLTHTNPFLPEAEKGKKLATGYSAIKRDGTREVMPFYETRGIAPAAGFSSNVKDLAAFASWQFRLLGTGGSEVLKSSTLREMQRVHWVDPDWQTTWGLGFAIRRKEDRTFVGHSGACPGYFSSLLMLPDKKQAAIIMVNAMNVNTTRFAEQLLKAVGATMDFEEPAKRTPEFEKFTGRYWSSWGETIVVPWKDGLASFDLPTDDPIRDLTMLKHIKGNMFRRVRTDDKEQLGEEIRFESGPDGKLRMWWHQNFSTKVE